MTSTDIPEDFWNSGSISRKGAAKPPDVITLTWASALCGITADMQSATAALAQNLQNPVMNFTPVAPLRPYSLMLQTIEPDGGLTGNMP